jgi:hypothetical protein
MIRLRSLQTVLWLVVLLLGVIAFRPLYDPAVSAFASEARFDHVQLVAGMFLYNGSRGFCSLISATGTPGSLPSGTNGTSSGASRCS